jgi:transcriptional regulator GlxA family with amidase domain
VEIVIPIFPQLTALDAVGPYEVLSRLPRATVRFLGAEPGPLPTENGMLSLVAEGRLADHPHPDIIVMPGGFGTRALMGDEPMLDWLREAHAHSQWTTSVCTGALVLAAAGILDGVPATTHWLLRDRLHELGAVPAEERVVRHGKIITAAGVSAGIDMALVLAAHLAGPELAQGIQLGIEYDPQPPFTSGSTATAPPEIVELVRRRASELA